ncbi:hypothetical protein [Pseudocnuella soli]|uniref:hypothetical protein n=1 Tax=Pseudocnuella soli TaxID=2502779 RepID=UPI001044A194|nr:hypothetical protein [Pseudocnuella soli]
MNKIAPLFAGVLLGTAAQAQETIINQEVLQHRAQSYLQKLTDTSALGKIPNIAVVAAGHKGVIILPQDGMTCIVPDTRGIAAIPNAMEIKKVPEAGRMPNAWNGKIKVMPVK